MKKTNDSAAKAARSSDKTLTIGGVEIHRGERKRIDIPVAQSYAHGNVVLPVVVVRGRTPGPAMFVSAAVHGDEINGVEIIRRLLGKRSLRAIRGTLIAVPVVNVYGFTAQTRYLPDRRDLNRSFPGSVTGSLAARLAYTFIHEIVDQCTLGIDLHTAAVHRSNLPQIRACIDDEETARLARAFGVPVILNADTRDGSLRQEVFEKGFPMLLYECGEALRFDEISIRAGVRGIISVMRATGMLAPPTRDRPRREPVLARSSHWVRAPDGGLLRVQAALGTRVSRGQTLGFISDPTGEVEIELKSPLSGVVIGRTELPLVNEGDALFHLALFDELAAAEREIDSFQAALDPETGDVSTREPPIA